VTFWRVVTGFLAFGALSSCNAPPSVNFVNRSGQEITITRCNGKQQVVQAGATGHFLTGELRCYATRPFFIDTAGGKRWDYPAGPRSPRGLSKAEIAALRDYYHGLYTYLLIDPDGAIFLLRGEGRDVTAPPDTQPPGYPLRPTGQ